MVEETTAGRGARFLLVAASLVVVLAGLRAASQLVLPFLVALFIAVLSLPLLYWFKSKGLPNGLAVALTVLVDIAVLAGVVSLVGGSVNQFTRELPKYRQRLEEMASSTRQWIEDRELPFEMWQISPEEDAEPADDLEGPAGEGKQDWLLGLINPGAVMDLVGGTLGAVAAVLSNAFLVVLTTIFILLEAAAFPTKLKVAMGGREVEGRFSRVTREVQRYLGFKTVTSMATGVLIGTWVALLGVDFPVLWGLVAFLFNYIPNLGSILAAVPVLLLAAIQFDLGRAALVGVGYVVVNVTIGNFVEPNLMGRRLGLSALVVFLSLIFWGWMWGPMGMLLSVPLTMIVKIMLENTEDFQGVAVLLGASSGQDPLALVPPGMAASKDESPSSEEG